MVTTFISPTNKDMSAKQKIFVAGHRGMVGSAIVRRLEAGGNVEVVTAGRDQLNLLDQTAVREFFGQEKPDQVYLAAAKVGGIHANNTFPADFIYENMMIEANIIHAAWQADVSRLLFLGSSCIYPVNAEQPMAEDALLTGKLEPTNEPYALAKIAGIKLCESFNRQHGTDFRSVMPTNLYGPGDNYHPVNSHVIPALIRRFHEAKESGAATVQIWGSGKPRREFLFVNDLAEACVFVMGLDKEVYAANTLPMQSHINVGSGEDVTIAELAALISRVVGFEGNIEFDASKPDGAMRKLLNVELMARLGWRYQIGLEEGLKMAYEDFQGAE